MQTLKTRFLSIREQLLRWPDGLMKTEADERDDEVLYSAVENEFKMLLQEISTLSSPDKEEMETMLSVLYEEIKLKCEEIRSHLDKITSEMDHSTQYLKASKAYNYAR